MSKIHLACLAAYVFVATQLVAANDTLRNVHYRGSLLNSRIQFETKKKGHVAFIGGSITEMNGYRPMVCEILKRRFPDTEFTFTSAGISSTCSTTGAFRLNRDVLEKGPVDLFFVEFAVNDDQDAGHARRECIRGMEGILRQTRRHNPYADIVITHFTNQGMIATINAGKTPLSSGSHEEVAKHYQVSTIDLAREVAMRIQEKTLTWKQYGGTHPAPFGNAICAKMIEQLLTKAWMGRIKEAKKTKHESPQQPLDEQNYGEGRLIHADSATIDSTWNLHVPNWKELPGGKRGRFTSLKLLCGTTPGAELELRFQGRAVGAYILAGPDAGVVEVRVDKGKLTQVDLFHRFSKGLHYPRTVMFATDLPPGEHTLYLRIADTKNKSRSGNAIRILKFVAN